MNVRLVSMTQSLIEERSLTAEELLVYIARVSNPANQLNTETADKLLGYMIRNKHWSPFDMVNMAVEVTTSRAIAHQILRHWSIKPQEFSQRYAEVTSYEDIELRMKADSNRQSSSQVIATVIHQGDNYVHAEFAEDLRFDLKVLVDRVGIHIKRSNQLYKDLIAAGIATECARFVLPLCTSTTMYLNGSVRSWIHYMEQRCDQHAQKEHRLVAEKIREIFITNFPNIAKALNL